MKRAEDLLFVGTHGHVRALSKKTGRRVWDTSLPRTGYDIVSLLPEDDVVYAASNGLLFALDALTGEILWTNGLKGLGRGHVLLATGRTPSDPFATFARRAGEDAAAAGAAATG